MNEVTTTLRRNRYVHIARDGPSGDWLVVNLLNSTYLALNDADFSLAHELLDGGFSPASARDIRKSRLLDLLTRGHFLVPTECDERGNIESRFLKNKFFSSDAGLGIVLTKDCNLRCVYCNQEHLSKRISDDDERRFRRFFSSTMSSLRRVSVTWWGGEPLLELDRIIRLSEHFIQECSDNNVHYSAYTSTNGVLISRRVASALHKCRFKQLQISIDGPQYHHDAHRPNAGGGGTYRKIMDGLRHLSEVFSPDELDLVIRVNISRLTPTNPSEWRVVFRELSGLLPLIRICFVPVVETFRFDATETLTNQSYHRDYGHLLDEASSFGIPIADDSLLTRSGELYCGAVGNKNWFLLPGGHLTKCTMRFDDPAEFVGHLDEEGNPHLNPRSKEWLTFNPFEHPLCKECDVLPACMGGCQVIDFDHASGNRCHVKNGVTAAILRDCRKSMARIE